MSDHEILDIRTDRMKYTKNASSARLCYLAILLDVFYFINIYESDVGNWYYSILIGASIIYNLLFMLFVFLASEGVKNYKKSYSVMLYIAAALQVDRVFIIPMQAMNTLIEIRGETVSVMDDHQGYAAILWLVLSAVAMLAAGLINQRKCADLEKHEAETTAAAKKEVA